MTRSSFQAMGTTFVVDVASVADLTKVQHRVEEYEAKFSRFRHDSELSKLNQQGRLRTSQQMTEVLRLAGDLCARTDGKFDISVGSSVKSWGYDQTFSEVTDLDHAPNDLAKGGWTLGGGVCSLTPGTHLDLGGLVKGWVADALVEEGLASMVSAGGDMRSSDPTLVAEVHAPDGQVAVMVPVGVGALATSSIGRRHWLVGKQDAHHLIDPATLSPAVVPCHSVSVRARTAANAEAAAKAVLLMGATGLEWADEQSWIFQAIAQWNDGLVYSTQRKDAA